MKSFEARHDPLSSCVAEIAEFRANMNMLEQAIRQERQELLELQRTLPPPGHPDHDEHLERMNNLALKLADHEVLLSRVAPELEALLAQCREREAQAPDTERNGAALETSLRRTIDDPRYWRDGNPALAQFVSEGFKRLYPDDSED